MQVEGRLAWRLVGHLWEGRVGASRPEVSEAEMRFFVTRWDVPLPHRLLWRLRYESDVEIHELLAQDVRHVDLKDRRLMVVDTERGRVRAVPVSADAAIELAELIGGRTRGRVFPLSLDDAVRVFAAETGRDLLALPSVGKPLGVGAPPIHLMGHTQFPSR